MPPLILLLFLLVLLLLAGCAAQTGGAAVTTPPQPAEETALPAHKETAIPTLTPPTSTATALAPSPSPAAVAADEEVPPFYFRDVVACGQTLPLVSTYDGPLVTSLSYDQDALNTLMETLPEEARPALEQLLRDPGTVGLAAYRIGREADGVFLNANTPMPLASVVKVLHLIAYANAVEDGELNPLETIVLDDLDRFYYRMDQRAHRNALMGLEEDGRIFGEPPALILDEVAHMMIEYSSNAATDYLHMRLGQERIEQTARDLGLTTQTAPCPFAGQFMIMANHTRPQVSDQAALQFYTKNPARYGEDVMQLTAAFSEDEAFHEQALAWRQSARRPELLTQADFSEQFNARGSAAEYAALMARVALNDMGSPDSSFMVRRHLEWPMQYVENQELFSNVAYKGGALPGILTTLYYAYPLGETSPIVVALFYHDLDNNTYQRWRTSLAHDEFARWLLYEPTAIPALRKLIQ